MSWDWLHLCPGRQGEDGRLPSLLFIDPLVKVRRHVCSRCFPALVVFFSSSPPHHTTFPPASQLEPSPRFTVWQCQNCRKPGRLSTPVTPFQLRNQRHACACASLIQAVLVPRIEDVHLWLTVAPVLSPRRVDSRPTRQLSSPDFAWAFLHLGSYHHQLSWSCFYFKLRLGLPPRDRFLWVRLRCARNHPFVASLRQPSGTRST